MIYRNSMKITMEPGETTTFDITVDTPSGTIVTIDMINSYFGRHINIGSESFSITGIIIGGPSNIIVLKYLPLCERKSSVTI